MIATYQFLSELRDNNRREWFAEHKAQYDMLRSRWLDQLQHLIDLMSQYDDTLHGVKAADCAYRIYRDIRFSHDKTPYKTFFSAVIGKGGRKCTKACYYVHFEPGNSGIFAGLWCPTPDVLRRTRSLIDADGNEKASAIADLCPILPLASASPHSKRSRRRLQDTHPTTRSYTCCVPRTTPSATPAPTPISHTATGLKRLLPTSSP